MPIEQISQTNEKKLVYASKTTWARMLWFGIFWCVWSTHFLFCAHDRDKHYNRFWEKIRRAITTTLI